MGKSNKVKDQDVEMEKEFQKWLSRKLNAIEKLGKIKLTKLDITIYRNCFYVAYVCGFKKSMKAIKK